MNPFNKVMRAIANCRTMWAVDLIFFLIRWHIAIGTSDFNIAWVCVALVVVDIFGLQRAISHWRKQ